MTQKPEKIKLRRLLWILFVLYIAALLILLFFRFPRNGYSYSLVPFATIRYWMDFLFRDDPLAQSMRFYSIVNLLGNVLAFVPLGIFLPALFRRQRSFGLFLLTVVLLVCLIELVQLLTMRGALDVDDLILNVPGACLGWLLWSFRTRKRTE